MGLNLDPDNARRHALVLAVIGFICGVLASYRACAGELSGRTVAIHSHAYRRLEFVSVLKEKAPEDFRHANNFLWAIGVLGFGVGTIGIYFYRGLDD